MLLRATCVAALVAIFGLPIAASADNLGSEVAEGRVLSRELRAGERNCKDLSEDQFELIGEYAMDRFLGNRATHEAMNDHMRGMMGEPGERRMHIALGYRYSGCGGTPASRWIGPMAGMMGGYGSGEGSHGNWGPGMMYGRPFGYGFNQPASSSVEADNGLSAGAVAAIAFGAALLAGLLVALGFWLRHRAA